MENTQTNDIIIDGYDVPITNWKVNFYKDSFDKLTKWESGRPMSSINIVTRPDGLMNHNHRRTRSIDIKESVQLAVTVILANHGRHEDIEVELVVPRARKIKETTVLGINVYIAAGERFQELPQFYTFVAEELRMVLNVEPTYGAELVPHKLEANPYTRVFNYNTTSDLMMACMTRRTLLFRAIVELADKSQLHPRIIRGKDFMIKHDEDNLKKYDLWITHKLSDGTVDTKVIKDTIIPNMPIRGSRDGYSSTRYHNIMERENPLELFSKLVHTTKSNMGPILDNVIINVSELEINGRDVSCVVNSGIHEIGDELFKRIVIQLFNFYYGVE